MKPFDYIVVLVSIVIGLAITDLTVSLHKLLRAGRRVRWHWAAPACALLAAMAVLRHFWAFYNIYRDREHLVLGEFLPIMLVLMLLFLGAAAALPDDVPAEGVDLKAFYLGNRLYFWGLTTAWLVLLVAINFTAILSAGQAIPPLFLIVNPAAVAITVSLAFVRRLWWHAIGIGLLMAGIGWSWMRMSIG